MPWRFGVYDVREEFPLYYYLHPREKTTKQGMLRFTEEDIDNEKIM